MGLSQRIVDLAQVLGYDIKELISRVDNAELILGDIHNPVWLNDNPPPDHDYLWVDTNEPTPQTWPPPVVTTLPDSPFDGMEVYYRTAWQPIFGIGSTDWHLKFYADWHAADGYGWVYQGGSDLFAEDPTGTTRNANIAYGDPTTGPAGPQMTLPLAGAYELGGGVMIVIPTGQAAGTYMVCALKLGATATSDAERVGQFTTPSATTSAGGVIGAKRFRRTLAAGTVVKMESRNNNGASQTYERWISARPIRVKKT